MPNEKVELHTNQHCTIVPSKFEDFDNNFNNQERSESIFIDYLL